MNYSTYLFFGISIFLLTWVTVVLLIRKNQIYNKKIEQNKLDFYIKSIENLIKQKNSAVKRVEELFKERTILVALLAQLYPSGIKKTIYEFTNMENIEQINVFIELPDGSQCSWYVEGKYFYLFENLPLYEKEWDGHSQENMYFNIKELIVSGSIKRDTNLENNVSSQIQDLISSSPSILDISLNSQNKDYRETMVTLHDQLKNMTITEAMEKWVKHADVDSSSFPKPSIYPIAVKDNNTEQTDGVIELITKFENPKK